VKFFKRLNQVLYPLDGLPIVRDDMVIYSKGDTQEEATTVGYKHSYSDAERRA